MGGLIFIGFGDAVTIHRRMIDDFGGDPGLRDRGLLESALAMPKASLGGDYLHPDPPSMAATTCAPITRSSMATSAWRWR